MANLSSLLNSLGASNNSVSGLLLPRQYSVAGGAAITTPAAVASGSTVSASVKLSDYGRLQSGLASLRDAAGKLNTPDKIAKLAVKSGNPNIGAAASDDGLQAQSALVQVSQLAQAQVVQSGSLGNDAGQSVGTGSLSIQLGSFNGGTNTFTASSQPAVSVNIDVLNASVGGIASAINQANAGVTASVVQDNNGGLRLQLAGNQTGANQAFSISVNDSDGNSTDNTQGLSRLAFNPSAAPGAGRNLTATQAAKDAQLTVNGRPFSSASNTITQAVGGVTLTAGSTGVAQISLVRDTASGLKSAQALVSAYNQFRDQLGGVSADGITRQIGSSLDAAVSGADGGNAGQGRLTLSQLGITQGGDGKLKLDEAKFNASFNASPEGASNLLATAAARTGAAADSAINGSLRNASNALRSATSSANPFVAQALQTQAQALSGNVPTLLGYSPTTQNLYGLAQYLAVSGL